MPKIEWSYAIYDRGDSSEKCSLLVMITGIEGLSSPAIFDSKSNLTELTTGRGYGFASEDFKTEAEAEAKLKEVDEVIKTYVMNVTKNSNKVRFQSRRAESKPETTE